MKKLEVTLPKLFFVAATRAALGAGVGLLAANKLRCGQRRRLGAALVVIGVLTTIPAALMVFGHLPGGHHLRRPEL